MKFAEISKLALLACAVTLLIPKAEARQQPQQQQQQTPPSAEGIRYQQLTSPASVEGTTSGIYADLVQRLRMVVMKAPQEGFGGGEVIATAYSAIPPYAQEVSHPLPIHVACVGAQQPVLGESRILEVLYNGQTVRIGDTVYFCSR